jgi:hypothetical protein
MFRDLHDFKNTSNAQNEQKNEKIIYFGNTCKILNDAIARNFQRINIIHQLFIQFILYGTDTQVIFFFEI